MFKKDNDLNSSHRKSVSGILKKSITTNKTNKSNKNEGCSMNDSKAKNFKAAILQMTQRPIM
ncbi:hypothetical protein BLA29_000200 [Euroglyphus maynei]|uniref:Uncharacterized protein n=1 Tax=Euroglyphus maynei TaxID=6958 RepID=A0A1Y3AQ82_EURMA|nr:hypothetical protein BLA29_000200 [Euroglyphus maynei]